MIAIIMTAHTAVLSTSMGDPSAINMDIHGYSTSPIHGKCEMRCFFLAWEVFRRLPYPFKWDSAGDSGGGSDDFGVFWLSVVRLSN